MRIFLGISNPGKVLKFLITVFLGITVSGCGFVNLRLFHSSSTKPKEYFSESHYGVGASPRVLGLAHLIHQKEVRRSYVGKPYKVQDRWYYPTHHPKKKEIGLASWYGDAFHGRLTANGEVYDMNSLTAAHPTMPLPSYARVTNLNNGSSVIVRVNDRGPFEKGRIIDLSKRASTLLSYNLEGTTRVRVDYLGPAPLKRDDSAYLQTSYRSLNYQLSKASNNKIYHDLNIHYSSIPIPKSRIKQVQDFNAGVLLSNLNNSTNKIALLSKSSFSPPTPQINPLVLSKKETADPAFIDTYASFTKDSRITRRKIAVSKPEQKLFYFPKYKSI